MEGFWGALSCLILYTGFTRLNFCSLVYFIIFEIQATVKVFVVIGTNIQKISFSEAFLFWLMWLLTIIFIFKLIAIYFAFQGYKEFKAIEQGNGGGMPYN